MAHQHDIHVPRLALIGAGLLIAITIGLAGLSRAGFITVETVEKADGTVAARDLYFRDREQGGIEVLSAETGSVLTVFEPGTNGFARGVLRGLVRERRAVGAGTNIPFRLVKFNDGRLNLIDPVTGQQVELVSFGATNLNVFGSLLTIEDLRS